MRCGHAEYWLTMRLFMTLRTVALTLLLAAMACSSSDATGPRNPLAGTWDVTTVLDTYRVEVGCPTYEYCAADYPADGASLSGQLVIDPVITDTVPHGTFIGAFCDRFDYDVGCTHVGPPTTVQLDQGTVTKGDTYETWNYLEILVRGSDNPAGLPGYNSAEHVNFGNVTVDGDSAYGTVYWARTIARGPPSYWGTFVAHRR
jgi:hypothetical protein